MNELVPGQSVIWNRQRGYGLYERIPAVVVSLGRLVTIHVLNNRGELVTRFVSPHNLSPAELTPSEADLIASLQNMSDSLREAEG
jgi:hypothetical protein